MHLLCVKQFAETEMQNSTSSAGQLDWSFMGYTTPEVDPHNKIKSTDNVYVTSREFKKKKKKKVSQNFVDHKCPHLTPLPIILIHSISPTSLLSFGRLSPFFLSFIFSLFFSFCWNTHTLTRQPPLQNTLSHHHFSGKITGKILRNSKASSSFYLR